MPCMASQTPQLGCDMPPTATTPHTFYTIRQNGAANTCAPHVRQGCSASCFRGRTPFQSVHQSSIFEITHSSAPITLYLLVNHASSFSNHLSNESQQFYYGGHVLCTPTVQLGNPPKLSAVWAELLTAHILAISLTPHSFTQSCRQLMALPKLLRQ
jgi:hypothetical protein